ncbi:hypothetical protein ERO13_D09G051250v2 [Gossypium hirsutum]|nr:hypothetical protein ERO13_D09G051250v2 [Gossypium hirsutum]
MMNFLELVTLLASYNDKVSKVILDNTPINAKYTSHMIQKEILHIIANKVRHKIREDIGDSKFCIIIDEARDESKKEKMTIALRYVHEKEIIKYNFFDLVHVQDTAAITLKQEICIVLSRHCLDVQNIRRLNQIGTVKRVGETHWSSHFSSVCSLIRISNYYIRGGAVATYKKITSFDFVFILHLVKEIMGITDILCQHLQQKSQDIVNVMYLVSSTKTLIQKLRKDGWDNLLEVVKEFCEKHNIEILDMDSPYVIKHGSHQHIDFNKEHHYWVEIFNVAIYSQHFKLNSRFNERTIDLFTLSSVLDPKDAYKSFNMDDTCCILQHYKQNVPNHPKLRNLSIIYDLCQRLAKRHMSKIVMLENYFF